MTIIATMENRTEISFAKLNRILLLFEQKNVHNVKKYGGVELNSNNFIKRSLDRFIIKPLISY